MNVSWEGLRLVRSRERIGGIPQKRGHRVPQRSVHCKGCVVWFQVVLQESIYQGNPS